MKKFSAWFKNLSRIGRFGFISAVALSGIMVISATASPPTENDAPTTQQPVVEEKKAPVVTSKTEVETEVIPFEKETIESSSLAKGKTQIQTAGVNGEKTITYTITLTDRVETDRTSIEEVTKAPIAEVTAVGTYVAPVAKPDCNPNYSGCVPNVSYDLNCDDIGYQVTVIGYDQYGLDGNDNDGLGCESY